MRMKMNVKSTVESQRREGQKKVESGKCAENTPHP
jgi:hypothetical protein